MQIRSTVVAMQAQPQHACQLQVAPGSHNNLLGAMTDATYVAAVPAARPRRAQAAGGRRTRHSAEKTRAVTSGATPSARRRKPGPTHDRGRHRAISLRRTRLSAQLIVGSNGDYQSQRHDPGWLPKKPRYLQRHGPAVSSAEVGHA